MTETTLVLVKPDGVQRRLIGEVLSRFERRGLSIVGLKMIRMDRALAEKHYRDHEGKSFYEPLLAFITSSPVAAIAVRGVGAIQRVRDLMGATKPDDALPGTIRGDFAVSGQTNLVHGSDSPENAERELGLYFAPDEILDYDMCDAEWLSAEDEV